MEYEIVLLKEKTIVGIAGRTNNQSPDMGKIIGGLWCRFYGDGIYDSIDGKINGKVLGIYTDYEGNEQDDYTVIVACEVSEVTESEQFTVGKIPAGRYAKFAVEGEEPAEVAKAWQKIWDMDDLPRSFICDFEEYQSSDMGRKRIHLYIGLRE